MEDNTADSGMDKGAERVIQDCLYAAVMLNQRASRMRGFFMCKEGKQTMKIAIEQNGKVIWMRDTTTLEGVACTNYVKDGTQQRIITALEDALAQAKGELLCWDNRD